MRSSVELDELARAMYAHLRRVQDDYPAGRVPLPVGEIAKAEGCPVRPQKFQHWDRHTEQYVLKEEMPGNEQHTSAVKRALLRAEKMGLVMVVRGRNPLLYSAFALEYGGVES